MGPMFDPYIGQVETQLGPHFHPGHANAGPIRAAWGPVKRSAGAHLGPVWACLLGVYWPTVYSEV